MSDTEIQTVDAAPDAIAAYIINRAKKLWAEKKAPLLLSNISPELKLRGVNYKDVLPEGTTLRQFVATLSDLRVVTHPIQKPKIGVVPKDSTFTFDVEPTVKSAGATDERPKRFRQTSQRYVVMQFLTVLSRLNPEEIKDVNIPVHVLARLMEEK
jgi:hypothetical protein